MLSSKEIKIIKSSWNIITKKDPCLFGSVFYNYLFRIYPDLRKLFKNNFEKQATALTDMFSFMVENIENESFIIEKIKKLAERHVNYGVQKEDYNAVGEALLYTIAHELYERDNQIIIETWSKLYTNISLMMIEFSK